MLPADNSLAGLIAPSNVQKKIQVWQDVHFALVWNVHNVGLHVD